MIRFILIPCVLVCVLLISAFADVPSQISYQGRLTDDTGTPVADGSYNITFEIHEHDPVPMGEPLLWSSGMRSVSTTDGLFVYYLGSNVPLPPSIFSDDGLESLYLRFFVEDAPVASAGVQLVTVPFAFKATSSDTAAYAHAGPGSGATGWIDDGSVVRLQNSNDNVGIGESSPSYRLVVGKNLGSSLDDEFIVCGNGYHDGYSGYRLGFNTDNYAEMKWYGLGEELTFNTRSLGTNYLNTLVMKKGKVGINNSSPSELLSIGNDLGAMYGDAVQIGDTVAGRYSGFMCGEDADNRGVMLWINNSNELRLGYKSGGTDYGAHLTLKDGEMHLTGSGDASVQLGNDAISDDEILDEPGIGRANQAHEVDIVWDEWATICTRTCDFPTSGYAVVLVACEVESHFPRIHLDFGVTLNSGPAPNLYSRYINFDGLGVNECWETFNFHEVFSVTGVSNTISLVGQTVGSANSATSHNTSMTIMFFPTAYGTVNTVAAKPDDGIDFSNVTAQPRLYTSEAASANAGDQNLEEGIRSETEQVASLRAEFDAQMQALKQEIAELKQGR